MTKPHLAYQPQVMPVETARNQAAAYSAAILGYSRLKGTVTPSGPLADTSDDQGVARGYSMTHAWSLYGIPSAEVGQGFDRIRQALPGAGWTIVTYGPANDADHTPEIQAEHQSDHYTVDIEWDQGRTAGDAPSAAPGAALLVTLNSPIYLAPKDVDLNTLR